MLPPPTRCCSHGKKQNFIPTEMTPATSMTAAEPAESDIVLVVTGFGPFGGVEENPSNILIRELPKFLQQSSNSAEDAWKAKLLHRVKEWQVVETSAEGAQEELKSLYKRMESDKLDSKTTVVFLHLGVNVFGEGFQVESCAYNDASFRIPDERGYQPTSVPILDHQPLGSPTNTELDVSDLAQNQTNAFPTVKTKVSTDPGRFVCNYLYYWSLNNASQATTMSNPTGTQYKSLFLHVPRFEIVPQGIQIEYVAELMRNIALTTN